MIGVVFQFSMEDEKGDRKKEEAQYRTDGADNFFLYHQEVYKPRPDPSHSGTVEGGTFFLFPIAVTMGWP